MAERNATHCTLNSNQVVEELTDFATMDDARAILWQWLKCTVTGSFHQELSRSERAAVVDLYEHIDKLLQVVYQKEYTKKQSAARQALKK
jgi:hypothetical protein